MSKSSKDRSTGSMSGYFDTQFKLLPGSYIDPISMRRKARLEEKKKNIVPKPFVTMYRARDPLVKTRSINQIDVDEIKFVFLCFFLAKGKGLFMEH